MTAPVLPPWPTIRPENPAEAAQILQYLQTTKLPEQYQQLVHEAARPSPVRDKLLAHQFTRPIRLPPCLAAQLRLSPDHVERAIRWENAMTAALNKHRLGRELVDYIRQCGHQIQHQKLDFRWGVPQPSGMPWSAWLAERCKEDPAWQMLGTWMRLVFHDFWLKSAPQYSELQRVLANPAEFALFEKEGPQKDPAMYRLYIMITKTDLLLRASYMEYTTKNKT